MLMNFGRCTVDFCLFPPDPRDPPHTQCTNTDVDFAAVWVLTEAFGNIAKQLTPRLTERYTRIYVPANRFQKLSL